MNTRPFDWRDLPTLHRFRHQSVFLHNALVLTRGPMLIPRAVISSLIQVVGIRTSVCAGDSYGTLIGQVVNNGGFPFAHLAFLTPDHSLDTPLLPFLLEHLMMQMGEQGVHHLLAEAEEDSQAFESLRSSGFAVYGRQRIWKITPQQVGISQRNPWRLATDGDTIAIRSLYNNLVPGLVQQIEPCFFSKPFSLIDRENGELIAYAVFKFGHLGVWVQLIVHPDAENMAERMVALVNSIPNRFSRPIYICVRSYFSWLEPFLEAMQVEAGPRQAVMVKHLAVSQKASLSFSFPALETGHPEATAPIVRSENHKY